MNVLVTKRFRFFIFFALCSLLSLLPLSALAADDDITVTVEVSECSDCAGDTGGESGSTATTGDSGNGSFSFDDLEITKAFESIVIRWETDVPTKSTVRWGKSASYEISSTQEGQFAFEHIVVIENLSVATDYFVRIDAVSDDGDTAFFAQKISTLSPQDVVVPPSVANVRAFHNESRVELRWENPRYDLFDSVRIMRSTKNFPLSPDSGEKVYVDDGEIFVDDDIDSDKTYYYSIFVRDSLGNYSGAALTLSTPSQRQNAGAFDELPDGRDVVPLSILNLTLLDIRFLQGDYRLDPDKKRVVVDSKQNVTLSIPAPIFPSFHSHVLLSVSDVNDPDSTYLYLFKFNEKNDAYEVTLQPFFDSGKSVFTLSFLDTNDRLYRKIEGEFVIEKNKKDRFTNIGLVVADAAKAGGGTILYGLERFGLVLIDSVSYYYQGGVMLAEGLAALISSMLMGLYQFFAILINGFIELVLAATNATRALGGIFSDTLTLFGMTTLGLYSAMTDVFGETVRLALGAFDTALASLGSAGSGIRSALYAVSGALGSAGQAVIAGVGAVLAGVVTAGMSVVAMFNYVGNTIVSVSQILAEGTATLARGITGAVASLGMIGSAGLAFGDMIISGIDRVTDSLGQGIVSLASGLALFGEGLVAISKHLTYGYQQTIELLGAGHYHAVEGIKTAYLSIGEAVVDASFVVREGYVGGADMMAASYESIRDLLKEVVNEIVETFKRFG